MPPSRLATGSGSPIFAACRGSSSAAGSWSAAGLSPEETAPLSLLVSLLSRYPPTLSASLKASRHLAHHQTWETATTPSASSNVPEASAIMVVASRWWVILKTGGLRAPMKQARGISTRDKHRRALTARRRPVTVASYHAEQGVQTVGLGGGLVPADAVDPRKTHGNAGFVTGRGLDRVKGHLQHQGGADGADRTEALDGVVTDEAVELQQLLVGETGIGLAHRHELVLAAVALPPGTEGIVGIIG